MPRAPSRRCPACRKPAVWEGNPFRPFCSERCRATDLGKWASGAYFIPGPPGEVAQEEAKDAQPGAEGDLQGGTPR